MYPYTYTVSQRVSLPVPSFHTGNGDGGIISELAMKLWQSWDKTSHLPTCIPKLVYSISLISHSFRYEWQQLPALTTFPINKNVKLNERKSFKVLPSESPISGTDDEVHQIDDLAPNMPWLVYTLLPILWVGFILLLWKVGCLGITITILKWYAFKQQNWIVSFIINLTCSVRKLEIQDLLLCRKFSETYFRVFNINSYILQT